MKLARRRCRCSAVDQRHVDCSDPCARRCQRNGVTEKQQIRPGSEPRLRFPVQSDTRPTSSAGCGSTAGGPWLSRALPHVSSSIQTAARYCDTRWQRGPGAGPPRLHCVHTGPSSWRRGRNLKRDGAGDVGKGASPICLASATSPLSLAAPPGRGHHPQEAGD